MSCSTVRILVSFYETVLNIYRNIHIQKINSKKKAITDSLKMRSNISKGGNYSHIKDR